MTSSFRPLPGSAATAFVATPRRATAGFEGTRSGAGGLSSAGRPADDPPRRSLTEAEVAELEAAAFDRGAESQRPELERFEHACEALVAAAKALDQQAERFRLGSPSELVDLALEIAQCWVGERFEAEPGRFLEAVSGALEACRDDAPERLLLSPADRAAIETLDPERLGEWKQSLALAVEEAPDLARGEFRIEAKTGLLDGRFEAVVARLRDALAADRDGPEAGE